MFARVPNEGSTWKEYCVSISLSFHLALWRCLVLREVSPKFISYLIRCHATWTPHRISLRCRNHPAVLFKLIVGNCFLLNASYCGAQLLFPCFSKEELSLLTAAAPGVSLLCVVRRHVRKKSAKMGPTLHFFTLLDPQHRSNVIRLSSIRAFFWRYLKRIYFLKVKNTLFFKSNIEKNVRKERKQVLNNHYLFVFRR